MKSFYRIFSFIIAAVLIFSAFNVISVSAVSEYVKPEIFIYGDVNLDGDVTVKDATLIQKDLAKITYITSVQKHLADPEGIGYSVKNATSIQKYLAHFETSAAFGSELVMASQDEFSKSISPNSTFDDACIIVGVKQIPGFNYSLFDFTEYDFKSIEVLAEFNNIKVTAYLLYLESPSEENIKEAIKSLDYRANIDVLWAQPNYIYDFAYD